MTSNICIACQQTGSNAQGAHKLPLCGNCGRLFHLVWLGCVTEHRPARVALSRATAKHPVSVVQSIYRLAVSIVRKRVDELLATDLPVLLPDEFEHRYGPLGFNATPALEAMFDQADYAILIEHHKRLARLCDREAMRAQCRGESRFGVELPADSGNEDR